jgi:hypothetical protein
LIFSAKAGDYRRKRTCRVRRAPAEPQKSGRPEQTERISMRISKRLTMAATAAVFTLMAGAAMAEGEKIIIGTEGA